MNGPDGDTVPEAEAERDANPAKSRANREQNAFTQFCDVEVLYHGFLCFAAIAVVVTQATILNFYIIAFFRGYTHHVAAYFWFLGDLFVVCIFAISFTSAYRYIHLRHKLELDQTRSKATEKQIRKKIQDRIYKNVSCLSPKYCGTLPFSFIAWLVYSTYLSAKIGLIFNSNIPAFMIQASGTNGTSTIDTTSLNENDPIHSLGTNLLKVSVGLSALVFIIMLQAHHNHQDNTAHGGYVLGVCHNIAVEVFDSATLLSLLIVPDKDLNYLKVWNFNDLIIVLSCLNLILPTLTLYSMSMSDFGRRMSKVTKFAVANQFLHLLVINVPFLGVRIYLWAAFNYELSLFVVKNLCYIFLLVHSLYPGTVRLFNHWRIRKGASRELQAPQTTLRNLSPKPKVRRRISSEVAMALDLETPGAVNPSSTTPLPGASREYIPMIYINDSSGSTKEGEVSLGIPEARGRSRSTKV